MTDRAPCLLCQKPLHPSLPLCNACKRTVHPSVVSRLATLVRRIPDRAALERDADWKRLTDALRGRAAP